MSPVLPRRGGLLVAAALLVGGLIATLPATLASAHDQLLSSSPAPGERLAAAPAEVTLAFRDDVLALGAVVIVADATGADWVAGDVHVAGSTVTVPLRTGMPDAGYEIRWRVVSGDGHPISDLIPFTVGDGEPYSSIAPSGDTTGDEAAPPVQPSSDVEVAAFEPGSPWRLVLVGGVGAAVAVAGFAVILMIRRRRGSAAVDPDSGRAVRPRVTPERSSS